MKEKYLNIFRPSAAPSKDIPLGARSVGHYIVKPGFASPVFVKDFIQIFWGIGGSGSIVIGGLEKRLYPGSLAIYFPGMEHNYFANDEIWEFRWWTLDGPLAVPILRAFGFASPGIYDVGAAPAEQFVRLEAAISDNTASGERDASALAYALLACASSGIGLKKDRDSSVREALELLHRKWADPELCVSSLSETLGLDRSVFSRRFRAETGVAPVKYLLSLRVQNALALLKHTQKPIAVIAYDCGWRDPNYFSRCIRSSIGLSPEEFRKS